MSVGVVNGQSPFGTPPSDSETGNGSIGFATLESFQRDVDSERIAAIARDRDADSGGDRREAARGREPVRRDTAARNRDTRPRERARRSRETVRRRAAAPKPPPVESIPLQRAARRATRTRRGWAIALTCVVVVVALAACGAVSWFLLRDDAGNTIASEQAHSFDPSTGGTKTGPDKLSSRDTDSTPLTVAELFDGSALAAGNSSYPVLKTQTLTDCAEAATGTMAPHLAAGDCTQVVRATVTDATAAHAATVGVVNLADADAAAQLRETIEDGAGGAFNALRSDGASAGLGLNPTVLGFNTYGHYLLYVVIGRADGESPSRQDEAVAAIVADLVDAYLVDALEPRAG